MMFRFRPITANSKSPARSWPIRPFQREKWAAIAESLVPKPRPGRSGHTYFADPSEEVAWQFPALRGFYLNQAQLSVKATHRMLLDLIEKKQRAWGLG